jgi:hypothetical protein
MGSDKAKSAHMISEPPNKRASIPVLLFHGQAEAWSTESSAVPYSQLAAVTRVINESVPQFLGTGAWFEYSNGLEIFHPHSCATHSRFWSQESR